MPIRIRKRIDSETLHLPELRHLIGKVVDITVEEEQAAPETTRTPRPDDDFWNPPSLEELARRQGIDLSKPTPPPRHIFSAEEFEGFDDWLRERRRGPWRAEEK